MTIYDATCVEIFVKELRTYVLRGGEPPVIPPLEDLDMMDALGDIAESVIAFRQKSGE